MISLELSMVQHNSAESARLSAATDEFSRRGGMVETLEYGIVRPFNIAITYNSPRGKEAAKTETMKRLRIIPDIEEAQAKIRVRAKRIKTPAELAEELKLVARIKAMRDLGVTRKQAAKHMDISTTLFTRLRMDYAIDYPLAVNRHK